MDFKKPSKLVSISTGTILKVLIILVIFGFLYLIRSVIGIVFIAWVLTSAVSPWVDKMHQKRIPRWLSILLIYLVLIGLISLVFYLIIPPIKGQIQQLASSFPDFASRISDILSSNGQNSAIIKSIQGGLENLSQSISSLTGGIFSTIATIFGGIVTFIAVLVITFYMTIEEDGMKKFLKSVAPLKYQPYLISKVKKVQWKMGKWLRGQIVLSLIVGVLAYIGLVIIGVDYALVLALIVAVTEFIPYVGPILGGIPAVFLAFSQSPVKAIFVVILYVIIQQLENSIISPKVMQKAVGLNPVVVIIALLIGGKVAGLVGVILAVPVATIVSVFLEDFFESKRREDSRLEVGPEGKGEADGGSVENTKK